MIKNHSFFGISIIIPVYNEAESLPWLLDALNELDLGLPKEIIVVDDDSTDDSAVIAEKYGATLIKHPYNKGNGAAVKTGIRRAQYDVVLIIDADGQHDPCYIPEIFEYMRDYDLVVGVRTRESESSLFRDTGNFVLKKVASYLVGMKIPDLTCGFRVFKKEKMEEFLHLCPERFSFPTTSTLAFIASGYNVKFVPIKAMQRKEGTKSKIRPFRDGLKFLTIILRIITLFNPIKVFMPTGMILFILGLLWSAKTLYLTSTLSVGALFFLVFGLNISFFGLLADQVATIRREIHSKNN